MLEPQEFNVVVELDPTEERTKGGIILPTQMQDRDELAADEGTLIAVSPHAFTFADWTDDQRRPQVGDRVLISRYGGVLRKGKDGARSLRIVKDKDVIAVIKEEVNG